MSSKDGVKLPPLDEVVQAYSEIVENKEDIDKGNLLIALLAGAGALLWYGGKADSKDLSEYYGKLRDVILEGPDLLNPYVLELLSILSEGLTNETFQEFLSKLRMILKEDTLDKLEV